MECVKLEIDNGIARVTLNRPDSRNAFNQQLINELIEFSAVLALYLRDEVAVHEGMAHSTSDSKQRLCVARDELAKQLPDRLGRVRPVGWDLLALVTVKRFSAG